MNVDSDRREILLVEYGKAQDSAEHHDNLVGNMTSLWLGSAVLIGFVLTALASKDAAHHKTVLCLVIAVGIALTLLVWTWADRAGALKKLKYDRCKEIETILGMEQHTRVDRGRRWQPTAYNALLGVLLATWIALLADVASLGVVLGVAAFVVVFVVLVEVERRQAARA